MRVLRMVLVLLLVQVVAAHAEEMQHLSIDWSTIPLDNIEKVEVIRGGSVARYGNNALGGVINVITKKPTETPTATLTLGTLCTRNSVLWTLDFGPWSTPCGE